MFEIQCGKKQQDDRICMGHFWIWLSFRQRMGGTKKLSKFIVDWENGTRVAYNNRSHRAGNVH